MGILTGPLPGVSRGLRAPIHEWELGWGAGNQTPKPVPSYHWCFLGFDYREVIQGNLPCSPPAPPLKNQDSNPPPPGSHPGLDQPSLNPLWPPLTGFIPDHSSLPRTRPLFSGPGTELPLSKVSCPCHGALSRVSWGTAAPYSHWRLDPHLLLVRRRHRPRTGWPWG